MEESQEYIVCHSLYIDSIEVSFQAKEIIHDAERFIITVTNRINLSAIHWMHATAQNLGVTEPEILVQMQNNHVLNLNYHT